MAKGTVAGVALHMLVYMVETEWEEQEYYGSALAGHVVRFVPTLDRVEEDAECLCVFLGRKIDRDVLQRLPNLKLLTTRTRAVDHIDLAACRERSLTVCNVSSHGEESVAEHTFALMLALSRRLREYMVLSQQSHDFSYEELRAFELAGKTLGIVGMGRSGRRVCELAHAFRMKVVATDPGILPDTTQTLPNVEWLSLEDLLRAADIVTLHVNLTPETELMLDRRRLQLCKQGAYIINTARGRLIETEALREALQSGHLAGAGLDVLEEESVMRQPATAVMTEQILQRMHSTGSDRRRAGHGSRVRDLQKLMSSESLLALPNVVFTPHVAFNSIELVEGIAMETVRNILSFSEGKPINTVR